jgi:hypothetical protein
VGAPRASAAHASHSRQCPVGRRQHSNSDLWQLSKKKPHPVTCHYCAKEHGLLYHPTARRAEGRGRRGTMYRAHKKVVSSRRTP